MAAVLSCAASLISLCTSTAAASDFGLSQLATAMQRVQRAQGPDRERESAEALAVLDRAPKLVQESAAGRYARSRLLEALGRTQEALAALPDQSALPARVLNDVRVRQASYLALLGRCDEALPLLVALEDVVGGVDKRALTRARLKCPQGSSSTGTKIKPAPVAPLTVEQKLRRAEKLTAEGRAEEALKQIDALKLPKALKAQGMHARGMALFRMRTRYPEAARVLAASAALKSPTEEEDAFFAARALARADQNDRAIKALRAFAQRYRTSKYAGEALYMAAWLELRAGQQLPSTQVAAKKQSVQALASWLETPHAKTHPSLAAEATFELGMHALRAGDPKLAGERFGRYAAMTQGCLERGRGFYWGGQAYSQSGQRAEAIALYVEATRTEPLCYYALLARNRLQALGEPMPPAYSVASSMALVPSSADPDGGVATPAPAAPPVPVAPPAPLAEAQPDAATEALPVAVALPGDVAFYASLGLHAEAVAALRVQEAALQTSAPSGRGVQALVHAYHSLGEHARPRALVHQLPAGTLTTPPNAHNAWAFSAAYARPYPDEVALLAQTEPLDPDLIYSVMLKESTFDPSVVSNADAIGLMQLLPATAKIVGRELGVTVTRETLFDARTNLRLGARLLRTLLHRYDDQAPLAIAAYNAGAHRVDAWLRRARAGTPPDSPIAFDHFVEDIPIDQTRNYVRRVMSFIARYRYLRDGAVPSAPETLTPPASLGSGKAAAGKAGAAASSERRRR